ncbi:phosphopantetheine-binding protein [Nonomuraea sp. NPDC050790]|uniref:phosphopantetheine-binding protein n=1 Tax=Nonomuraea sp. NPDC050790 TaxID=3364371 RepID=UPI0037885193
MDELTTAVRAAWEQSLNVSVGDDADFFRLGGDSMKAIAICAKVEESCQVRPRLRVLFDNPRFDAYVSAVSDIVREKRR